jgi:hypothetical protein
VTNQTGQRYSTHAIAVPEKLATLVTEFLIPGPAAHIEGVLMKKWVLGGLGLLLLGAAAVFGFVYYKTGMGPLTLMKAQQGGFQTAAV